MESKHSKEEGLSFDDVIRYPFNVLKFCGALVHRRKNGKRNSLHKLHICYCVFINIFIWMDLIRIIFGFAILSSFSGRSIGLSAIIVAMSVSAFFTTFSMINTTRQIPNVMKAFHDYRATYELCSNFTFRKRTILTVIAVHVIVAFVTLVATSLVVAFANTVQESILMDVIFPFQNSGTGFRLLMTFVTFIRITISNTFLVGFIITFYVIGETLYDQYNNCRKIVERKLQEDVKTEINLESQRIHHHKITSVLNTANVILQDIAMMQYMTVIPVVCLILYGFIRGGMTILDLFALLFNVLFHFCFMIWILLKGARLNESVSKIVVLQKGLVRKTG